MSQLTDCSTSLVVNILGLLNIVLHLLGRNVPMHRLQVVGVCLPSILSVMCALVIGLIYREQSRISSTALLSEEEMLRRQLQRLLQEQSSAPSPELIRNTYRFDLPEDVSHNTSSWDPLAR